MPKDFSVKKSRNFDTNLDAKRQIKQLEKNLYRVSEDLKTKSREYVPISTRTTYNSLKTKKKDNKTFTHSTINWRGSYGDRYNYTKSTVAKNSNKFKWFSRAFKDNEGAYRKEIRKDVYK